MAKKDNDSFDFEVEGEGKAKGGLSLNLDFIKNLTKQQKGIILGALIAIVLVVAIIVVVVIVGAGDGGNTTGGNTNPGGDNSQTGNGGSGDGEMPGEIQDFQIASRPNKTVYYVGDSANYEGLLLYYRDVNGESKYIYYTDDPSAFTITGFDSSIPAENQVITVESAGFKVSFTVKILAVPEVGPRLESIYLNPMPQTTYTLEDAFRFNGAKIVAVYSDGTTKTELLTMNHIDGWGAIDSVGEHEILIRYFDDNGGYAETTLTITITE